MDQQNDSFQGLNKILSMFSSESEANDLKNAADHYLELIETSELDLVYWPRDKLAEAARILQATRPLQPERLKLRGYLDVNEEFRLPPKPDRLEEALFQVMVVQQHKSN